MTGPGWQHAASALDGIREIALPVAVVSAADGPRRSCSTGTLTYVSISPATVVTPLAPSSRTLAALRASGVFSLSLLGAGQRDVAALAGRPASTEDKFAELAIPLREVAWRVPLPAVDGALAVLCCSLAGETEVGDHVACFGRVELAVRSPSGGAPLVRLHRGYAEVAGESGTLDDAPYPI